jgi:hypothetical protein
MKLGQILQLLTHRKENAMWSMWNAPSDLDYYGQCGGSGDEPEDDQQEEELEPPDEVLEDIDPGPEPPAEEEEQGEQQ